MYYLTLTPIGLFATDENNNLRSSIYFSKDPKKAAKQYLECKKAEVSKEEQTIIRELHAKENEVIFELKKEGYSHEFPNPAGDYARANMLSLSQKTGFSKEDFNRYIYDFSLELTRQAMRSEPVDDKLINQSVSAIDDLDKIINQLSMRLREWYGMYFPELTEKIRDNEKFAEYVKDTLYRSEFQGIDIEDTIGSEISKNDLEEERRFAETILTLFGERKTLEKYIDQKCKETIPNITAIIGSEMASRILAHAGSKEKLAKFPSSTIQILGAEKALFRYLHNVGTSPKHGIIFNTGFIQRTPKEKRGKVARMLASKLSIAAKLDCYGGEYMGDKLKADMEKILENVMKEKPRGKKFPPKKPTSFQKPQGFASRPDSRHDKAPRHPPKPNKPENRPSEPRNLESAATTKGKDFNSYIEKRSGANDRAGFRKNKSKPSYPPKGPKTESRPADTFRKFRKGKNKKR